MDSPSIYEDEVVADSEDEGSGLMTSAAYFDARALLQDKIPPEITQDTILSALDTSRANPSPISSISDPTTSSSVSRPRPKLRWRHKKDTPDATSSINMSPPSNSTSSDIHKEMEFTASNIADRAKMRSRNTKSRAQQSIVSTGEIIELSSDDDDDFNLIPASRTRRKAANKAQAKAKATGQSKSPSGDMEPPDPKPRPRPRPITKQKLGKNSDPTSPLSGVMSQATNHLPTSSISNGQYPIPFKLLPSQLPPSDPPTSTATTYEHPPIATLPQTDTDQDPHSSPSSLFSVYSSGKKKRRRVMSNVDELDSDQGPVIENRMDIDRLRMPPPPLPDPPPTFFAGSSSPLVEVSHSVASRSTDTNASAQRTSAPKKTRKKKVTETDDREDVGCGAGESKAKPKTRMKKASATNVEVVIERPKVREKGKVGKEVFKSREFIDEEDDNDAMDLGLTNETNPPRKPDSLTSLSSVSDSDLDDTRKAEPSKKRKSVDRDLATENENREDGDQQKPKRRATIQGKGRRLVGSDNEGDELQDTVELTSSKDTLEKVGKKGKGNEKQAKAKRTPKSTIVTDSDFEDGAEYIKEMEELPGTSSKENIEPAADMNDPISSSSKPPAKPEPLFPSLSSRYTIAPRTKSTPMSDLIRRVNSKPGSPFCSPAPRGIGSTALPSMSTSSTAYSPYVKASRSALSRIAPLHPNRRTPPRPLPPPPPKKKTKKELEREEQWEEELIESVGGITEWACMSDAERKEMRKAKREQEMYGWED